MIADGAGDAAAPVVIRLMEKFALLCEYDDGSKRRSDEDLFLVPAVLPRDIPRRYRRERVLATAHASEQHHRCAVQFTRFMPQGMWERILCRCVKYAAVRGHCARPRGFRSGKRGSPWGICGTTWCWTRSATASTS